MYHVDNIILNYLFQLEIFKIIFFTLNV